MGSETLITYKEAARRLRVYPTTVGDLVRGLGIPERVHPRNENAKALTPDEFDRLAEVLSGQAAGAAR